jgi:hypothetical protein
MVQVEMAEDLEKVSFTFVESCLISVASNGTVFFITSYFDHHNIECMRPLINDNAIDEYVIKFNR